MLDDLEQQRLPFLATSGLPRCRFPSTAGFWASAIATVRTMLFMREDSVDETWISNAHQMIQKVVFAPSRDGKSADLTIHGRLAAILAARKRGGTSPATCATRGWPRRCKRILRLVGLAGGLRLSGVRLHLGVETQEAPLGAFLGCRGCLVAGAGFEPAAFRL